MDPDEFKQRLNGQTDADTTVHGRPTNVDIWVEDEQEFLHLIDSTKPDTVFFNEMELTEEDDEDSKIVGASFFIDQRLIGIESAPENAEDHQKREEDKKEEMFHRLRGLEDYVPRVPSQDRLDRYSLEELQEKVEEAERRQELISKLEGEGIEVTNPSRQTIRELERMLGNREEIREAQLRQKEIAEEVASSARYNLGLSRKAVNLLIEEIAPEVNENPNLDKSTISELARAYRNIKVRPQQMEEAKKLLEEGKSQTEVSEILGVSTSLVREANRRENIW
ncbi:hypothetical protein GLW36_05800 [Halorubrum terrestre]|uniref:Uncharacterized protein n=1 Tax=Halorubrum distributum TaxID=29283 RepID=A0A6B1IBQ0_9EURY|nr:hypothetical protein [Halorubrum terrestre]MYL16163.1 hypothetical protein [Halorubrum terrestre]